MICEPRCNFSQFVSHLFADASLNTMVIVVVMLGVGDDVLVTVVVDLGMRVRVCHNDGMVVVVVIEVDIVVVMVFIIFFLCEIAAFVVVDVLLVEQLVPLPQVTRHLDITHVWGR